MYEMIEKRPDWCVSRQRFWGVPIIVFYCEGCGKRLEDFKALRNVVKWFEEEGADAWYRHSSEKLLPAGTTCACGATKWRKENDILDVWFDSGSSNLSVLKGPSGPRTFISKAPINIAAGSTVRCLWPPACVTVRRIAVLSPTAGRSTNKAARCPSLSATRSIN